MQNFNVEPTDKSSPSAPTSSTGHQIWPFSDLVSYYESMIDSYIPLPFPFFEGAIQIIFCFQRSCACEDGGWTLAMVNDGTWHTLQTPKLKILPAMMTSTFVEVKN